MSLAPGRLPLGIGLRYLSARRRNHFISFISASSMIGMTLGVAVLILVLSVMNGFDRELRERILGMVPQGLIYKTGGIQDWRALSEAVNEFEGVVASAPIISLQGMMGSSGKVHGVMVSGIDPEAERLVSILPDHVVEGSLGDLHPGGYGVLMGNLLARRLQVEIGDSVTLMLPEATLSPAGVLPRVRRLTLVGIYKVGAELDANTAIIHIEDARKLGRIAGEASALRIKFEDLFQATERVWTIINNLKIPGYYSASDWTRTHGNLFAAIRMEKTMIGLLLLIVVAVAAFNIISTLVMVVTDKQSDIAILRTMGARPATIMAIFMVQGLSIGLVGVLIGSVLGVVAALTISDLVAWAERMFGFQILNADVYFISYLPSQLLWSDVLVVVGAGLCLSFLATLYPSYRASRVNPAEALRYE